MSSCCNSPKQESSCHEPGSSVDYLLWGSILFCTILYVLHWQFLVVIEQVQWLEVMAQSVYSLLNIVWWGILLGIVMLALLSKVPREFVICVLGTGTGFGGIMRATIGGVLLDLCSHGILMVGAKLYERGASVGQVMAFLIASPWNSFSLTIILFALIGLKWTLFFIFASMLIALFSGWLFDSLEKKGVLPANSHTIELPSEFNFWYEAKMQLSLATFNTNTCLDMLKSGILESRMVVRWILFGVLLASLIRAFVDVSLFQQYFGPTMVGLIFTLIAATVIEVCSEGSAPIAADLLTRAKSPGNSFAFLMAGVSTDYTEVMVLKESTRSWKIALFLPLITVPQIFIIAWLVNLQTS
ncbi:MAG: permease [Gammaproteobacteria bacterium]|nr:permease [Gammaproteobacteria bacterium]